MVWQNNVIKDRKDSIDIAKYVASLLVIAIHTGMFSDVNETLCFGFVGIICRIAVPFFAICTGYFLGIKAEKSQGLLLYTENNRKLFYKQWKKMVRLYGIWSIIYLFFSIPRWIKIGWFSPWAFVDYTIGAFLKGSYYHLWYLLSVIYALPLLFLLLLKVNLKYCKALLFGLYLVKVSMYGYIPLLDISNNKILGTISKFSGMTDAVFCILPFILMGVTISEETEENLSKTGKNFLLFLSLWFWEAATLKAMGLTSFSYLLFTLPTSYYLFKIIIRVKWKSKKSYLKNMSASSVMIYCAHPMILETIMPYCNNTILNFGIVALLSTIVGYVLILLPERYKRY